VAAHQARTAAAAVHTAAAAAHQARTAAAAHQARTAAEQAAAAQAAAAQAAAAQAAAARTEAAQVAAAQPFLHFCGSAFLICGDQACDLASRCATAPADPPQAASSWQASKTSGDAS
jgi:chemosensory pili system protein ChpA (sensor histidine kinase/response regulator)